MASASGVMQRGAVPQQAARMSWATGRPALLCLYGAAHLVVDTICAAVVFHCSPRNPAGAGDLFCAFLFLYHALAFGLQPAIGLFVDMTKTPRRAAVAGCLLTAIALLFLPWPVAAVVLAGVGNAVFHIGGGIISLRLTPGRATAPGLFVAPGSLGLLLGAILGQQSFFLASEGDAGCLLQGSLFASQAAGCVMTCIGLAAIAVVVSALMAHMPVPADKEPRSAARSSLPSGRGEIVLVLILGAIVVRSYMGFLVTFPWETQPWSLVAVTLAAVAGKALGGWWADHWGWRRVAIGASVCATPLLVGSSAWPLLAIPGLFLLNVTMPVTLAACAAAVPGYPGFAFGLTCLAILGGALPMLLSMEVGGPWSVAAMLVAAAAALYYALRRPCAQAAS